MNRITQEHIDRMLNNSTFLSEKMGEKTTVVMCRLPNGFVIVESSSCVDPLNYDHELGLAMCRKRIEEKVWLLEGYRLQCEMAINGSGEDSQESTPGPKGEFRYPIRDE